MDAGGVAIHLHGVEALDEEAGGARDVALRYEPEAEIGPYLVLRAGLTQRAQLDEARGR